MSSSSFFFSVEHAKSGRAKCKGCGDVIVKDSVRVGIRVELASGGEEPESTTKHIAEAPKWYHLKPSCVQAFRKTPAWWLQNGPTLTDFEGLSELDDDDKTQVEEMLRIINDNVRAGRGPSGTNKRKTADEPQDAAENEEPPNKKASKKSSSALAATDVETAYSAPFLDEDTQDKVREQMGSIKHKTVTQLKSMLKANEQRQSGKKDELIERVAEAMVLGALPKCPDCGRPGLKVDRKTGNYSCVGGFDNGVQRCKFRATELTLVPWRNDDD